MLNIFNENRRNRIKDTKPTNDAIIKYLSDHVVEKDNLEVKAKELLKRWDDYVKGGEKNAGQKLVGEMAGMLKLLKASGSDPKWVKCKVKIEKQDPHSDQDELAELVATWEIKFPYTAFNDSILNTSSRFKVIKVINTAKGDVAIKCPSSEQKQDDLAAIHEFKRELRQWSSLEHKHLLPYWGNFKWRTHDCVVSPLAANKTLTKFTAKNPGANVVRLLKEVADGLAYIHSKGRVHGDVSRDNILVTGNLDAQICDFGQTKIIGHLTSTAQRLTPFYVSPEVREDSDTQKTAPRTFASDVYAFGILVAVTIMRTDAPFDVTGFQGDIWDFLTTRVYNEWTDENGQHQPPLRPARPTASEYFGPAEAAAWAIAEECWRHIATDRPSMAEVFRRMELVLTRFPDAQRR